MMYNCNNHKTIFSHNKGVPVANSIHHSNSIYNYFKSLKLGLFLSDVYLNHLMIIMVSVMLSCNGIILNYAVILYDRSKSKIQIVQEIAQELPVAPVVSYFLCDSWYTSVKVMDSFIQKGFYTIGALKTNRIIYPFGIRQKSQRFCPSFTKNRYGRQPCDRWRT